MASTSDLADVCRILSVPARVRIVELLSRRTLCVGALAGRLSVTQGAVSQHLRILKDAGLVVGEKRGYYVHYRLNRRTLARCKSAINKLLDAALRGPGTKSKGKRQCPRKRTSANARNC